VISAQAGPVSGTTARRTVGFDGFTWPWALLCSVVGGIAVFVSFPPLDAWPVAVVGPALLVIALTGRSLRGSFWCGLAFGVALFVPLLTWLLNVAWYAWAALAGAEAVIFALLAVGQRLLLRLPFWPAAVAGWWVVAEGFRDRWPFAFPWGRLAMSQSVAPDVRWVAVGGAPLLTFLVALVGALAARAVLCCLGGSDPPQTPPAPGGTHPPRPPLGGAARPPVPAGQAAADSPGLNAQRRADEQRVRAGRLAGVPGAGPAAARPGDGLRHALPPEVWAVTYRPSALRGKDRRYRW
jgi:hypothetical protein